MGGSADSGYTCPHCDSDVADTRKGLLNHIENRCPETPEGKLRAEAHKAKTLLTLLGHFGIDVNKQANTMVESGHREAYVIWLRIVALAQGAD